MDGPSPGFRHGTRSATCVPPLEECFCPLVWCGWDTTTVQHDLAFGPCRRFLDSHHREVLELEITSIVERVRGIGLLNDTNVLNPDSELALLVISGL